MEFYNVAILWQYHDGGRKDAGFTGDAGDCVTRAIAIATERPYQQVYDALGALLATDRKWLARGKTCTPRNGVPSRIYKAYLAVNGWTWTPTMGIGTGCRVHLAAAELPLGRLVVRVSKHLCAVIDRVLLDTHDCSRTGTRCVYGYWSRKAEEAL